MNTTPMNHLMRTGEIWVSEWDVEWRVVEVHERHAVVKRIGGRSLHHVTATDVRDWARVEEVAAMREP